MKKENNSIRFFLNDREIEATSELKLLEIIKEEGLEIPHLCFNANYRPDGNCRSCLVEIEGEKTLAPSCCRKPEKGMKVYTHSQRAESSRKMILEMLNSDTEEHQASKKINELKEWSHKLRIGQVRMPKNIDQRIDNTNPAIAVNYEECIKCTRCIRACREAQANDVIGFAFRGKESRIVFDIGDDMGSSTCVSCGECVQACPTNALISKTELHENKKEVKKTNSVCPYCGVGCLLTFNTSNNKIFSVTGRDGPSNKSRLCVKGRYGFDYIHHKDRLTLPLIRKPNAVKTKEIMSPENINESFRTATWDEALELTAKNLKEIYLKYGSKALAGLGCAKGSNEEAYLFQKLIRTAFKTNNVDHCTRLCHASSVSAMLEMLGSAAVSNQVSDVKNTEVIIVIGAKPSVNHPVAATFIKNVIKDTQAELILMDPYRSDLARHSKYYLQFRPDTDVLLLNAIMHTIINENLHDRNFIRERTEDFLKLETCVQEYPPEKVSSICGIDAETIRKVARLYARAKRALIFWGMGVSQHTHGTDNARCLISLALLCGHIGKEGSGIHPLRGQNNVQGASDSGLIPMVYPNYQPVSDDEIRKKFEKLWGQELNPNIGLTVIEIAEKAFEKELKGLYIMGENPAMSDPNLNFTREALSRLDFLVVQDIFFTETAGFADVILPASAFAEKDGTFTNTDRRVQLGRKAVNPPGEARQDLWIIQDLANRLGLNWQYKTVQDVFNELKETNETIGGISWEMLQEQDSVTYPFTQKNKKSEPILFAESFPTKSGKATFVPANFQTAEELPDTEYPFVFITGRHLEHWHTGSMTSRSQVLHDLEPEPTISLNPEDIKELNISGFDKVSISSRRGQLNASVRVDANVQRKTIFMAFCFADAAANLITNEAMDPFGKIPEFKYCAAKITPIV